MTRILASLLATATSLFVVFLSNPAQVRTAEIWRAGFAASQSHTRSSPLPGIYSPDTNDIRNQVFRLFYVRHVRHTRDGRQYGGDELDPYLWPETKYPLTGSSHKEALKLLDEFLGQHAERSVTDALKRALFQRDLLAVYDWLSFAGEQTRVPELQKRVSEIIRRVALSEDQVQKLPDNYDAAIRAHLSPANYDPANPQQPFLPADLFDPKGPWV